MLDVHPILFLGSWTKSRKLIEDNRIGKIVLGTFNLMSHGMDIGIPNPDFFFKPGAGPFLMLEFIILSIN